MEKRYLVKMTPLEPYFLGNDQGFAYVGEKTIGKISYFAKTENIPSQTTILGMLRYMVLENKNLVKTNFMDYEDHEIERNKKIIGERSFDFDFKEREQDFGCIKKISPLFIMKGEDILIKNPFNNKEKIKGYEPIKLNKYATQTSNGKIALPVIGEYDLKKGHASGYINIRTKDIYYDIFKTYILTGNRKNNCNVDRTESFFKREISELKEGLSFAVYVDAEEESFPMQAIEYLGGKRSTFKVEIEESDKSLSNQITEAFKEEKEECYYALSDLFIEQKISYNAFCIVETKYQRNLQTNYKPKTYTGFYKKRESRINLIENGSVFYSDVSNMFENDNAKKIGYNYIVKLGRN